MTGRHLTNWTTCNTCGKRTYNSRKDARQAAKQHPGHHMSAYPCGPGWHIGHLPAGITGGTYSRNDLRGAA